MGQAGIPLFYLQGMGGGAVLKFRDLFNDSSIYWAWEEYKGTFDLVHKNVQEINGQMLLSVTGGYKAYWDNNYCEAPKIFIGLLTLPCEIITRLDVITSPINDDTMAGLFITKRPTGFGSTLHYSIGRARRTSAGLDGLAVMKNSRTILASNVITTLPVWLKIRMCSDSPVSTHAYFDYSLDGINWSNLYELTGFDIAGFSVPPTSTGLYVVNGMNLDDGGTKNGIHGKFDFFQMKPKSIN